MRYGQNLLDEILRRTDLVQLVGRKVKLARRGGVFWGCCPFHKEKSASFKVENARRMYKCFGCGASGDAFKWLEETEGLTFPEAVEKLAQEAGVALPQWSAADEARAEQKKSLYDVVEAAAVFFENQLRTPSGETARDYLKNRGLSGQTARRFRLGYAPNGGLTAHLSALKIPLEDIIAAGLAKQTEGGVRDFFFNRLMFPISDGRGRIVAFGGRGLSPDAKPKYINTGETVLFSKGQMLYNYADARKAAIKDQSIILCEGYMDVIALVVARFEAAVAPLGTALTEEQLQLLWRVAPEPTVTFDGDAAGLKAAQRAARLALPALKPGFSLRFAFVPAPEDPDSLIRAAGPAAMRAVLDQAQPLVEVLWRTETEGRDFATPESRAGLEKTLSEIVGVIGDAKVAEYYKRDFDERVFNTFKRHKSAPRPKRTFEPGRRAGRGAPFREPFVATSDALKSTALARLGGKAARQAKEYEVCTLLLAEPALAEIHAETLAALPFSDPLLDRFCKELLNLAASDRGLERTALNDHLANLGMDELLSRLSGGGHAEAAEPASPVATDETQVRFTTACRQLRELARSGPTDLNAADALLRVVRRNTP